MSEDDPVATPIILGVIAAGTAVQQNQQAQAAKGQANWARRQQQRAVAKARRQAREYEQLEEVTRTRAAARAEQMRRRAAASGYRSTLLTGPLGAPSTPQPLGMKTLLGS